MPMSFNIQEKLNIHEFGQFTFCALDVSHKLLKNKNFSNARCNTDLTTYTVITSKNWIALMHQFNVSDITRIHNIVGIYTT